MLSIIGSVLSMGAPLIIWGIKTFIGNKMTKEKYVKNYYDMIAKYSAKGATKVANYIAAENSLANVQLQIREENLIEPIRNSSKAQVKKKYIMPIIIDVETDVETHGNYLTENGKELGLVIHYTAGRFLKGAEDAKNILIDLAKRGLGCLVMDIEGQIYKAKNQKLDEIAWHAGESAWLGHTGMSRYLLGMEICNAGLLSQEKDTWGQTYWGDQIATKNTRTVPENNSNQSPGLYHIFNKAQEKSLLNFVLWRADVNPIFDIDYVAGHDEVAPERKQDPGGSLSMTMLEYRAMIKKKFLK